MVKLQLLELSYLVEQDLLFIISLAQQAFVQTNLLIEIVVDWFQPLKRNLVGLKVHLIDPDQTGVVFAILLEQLQGKMVVEVDVVVVSFVVLPFLLK